MVGTTSLLQLTLKLLLIVTLCNIICNDIFYLIC